ncbi:MAG: methyltransferase domain-containing protein [Patescibacteria group bacterium]|jgi:predicted SAM-dependent methyltransferase
MFKEKIQKLISLSGYELKKIHPDLSSAQENNFEVPYDKIHYGAGLSLLKGWVNADFFVYWDDNNFPDQIKIDLSKRHPFADATFNFGYSQDFLEHLTQADQIIFLEEVFRTFKPGGVLRLSFPGLEGSLKKYFSDKNYSGCVAGKRAAFTDHLHFHLPSFEELVFICRYLGFSEIKKVNYGHSIHSELCNLDTREGQVELNTFVEIIK